MKMQVLRSTSGKRLLLVILACGGLFAALAGAPTAGRSAPLSVVATIHPLAEIARAIGGDLVSVQSLLPAGASPHTFEARPSHVRAAAEADLFLAVGGGLDDWSLRILADGRDAPPVVRAAEVVALAGLGLHPFDDGHDHAGIDPHVWLDPLLVRDAIAPEVARRLIEIRPDLASRFEENLSRFQEELTLLDARISSLLDDVATRRIISFHSAWGYFARRYGLETAATVADFPGQEPSARWVAEVVRIARAHGVRVIFAEPQFSPKAAEAIAAEIGGDVLLLDPIGASDFPDRNSYVRLMEYNARMIREALVR